MAKETIHNELHVIEVSGKEAADLIGLLAAQLAGVPLSGNASGEVLKNSYTNAVKEEARRIIEDKVSDIFTKLNRAESELKDAVNLAADGHVVTADWILSQLAGMSFPEQGGAYDYVKKILGK